MGKAAVIPELVEWYTYSTNGENMCVGCFSDDANRNTILSEIADAPVDLEDLKSRTNLIKSRKEIETNPLKEGYSESKIVVLTNKDLDPLDLSNLPYELDTEATKNTQKKLEDTKDTIEFRGKSYKYQYQFKIEVSEQVA